MSKEIMGSLELNRIYQMDCVEGLKLIPESSIDMIFTDPPYKLTGGGSKDSLLRKKTKDCAFTENGEVFRNDTPSFDYWIPSVYKALKEQSYAFFMCNDRNIRDLWDECEKAGFIFCELLVMNKSNAVPSSYFYKSCEFILMFRKGGYKKFEKFGQRTVIDVVMPRGKNKIHPTQKPINLIIPILEACSKEGDLIIDPFMGSASTAVASQVLNRKWIGFELDGNYIELGNKRLESIELHTDLNKLI